MLVYLISDFHHQNDEKIHFCWWNQTNSDITAAAQTNTQSQITPWHPSEQNPPATLPALTVIGRALTTLENASSPFNLTPSFQPLYLPPIHHFLPPHLPDAWNHQTTSEGVTHNSCFFWYNSFPTPAQATSSPQSLLVCHLIQEYPSDCKPETANNFLLPLATTIRGLYFPCSYFILHRLTALKQIILLITVFYDLSPCCSISFSLFGLVS